jgi:hypothetical protein
MDVNTSVTGDLGGSGNCPAVLEPHQMNKPKQHKRLRSLHQESTEGKKQATRPFGIIYSLTKTTETS